MSSSPPPPPPAPPPSAENPCNLIIPIPPLPQPHQHQQPPPQPQQPIGRTPAEFASELVFTLHSSLDVADQDQPKLLKIAGRETKARVIRRAFGFREGLYMLVAGKTDDPDVLLKWIKGVFKTENCEDRVNNPGVAVPFYVGSSGDLWDRFRKHSEITKFFRRYEDFYRPNGFNLFLWAVGMEAAAALAFEEKFLGQFDFMANGDRNGGKRVQDFQTQPKALETYEMDAKGRESLNDIRNKVTSGLKEWDAFVQNADFHVISRSLGLMLDQ